MLWSFLYSDKDLYSRKDLNLVFSRFISRGEVLCYNRAKINSFILKCLENSYENQPITRKFVLYIVYILHKTIFEFADIGSMEKFFLIFFCITLHTRKMKKKYSRVSCILKHIKNDKTKKPITQVLFYISNTHLYTLVCRFHVNKEVYWFINRPPPFTPKTPPFWQMMVDNP